jgi:uncharacterized membrane protein YjfL (UPF0719 family)
MEYLDGVLASMAYAAVGFVLLWLGFVLIDLLTPGKLHILIWQENNPSAAIVLSSGLLSTGLIITTAIVTSHADLVGGLVSTTVYGLIGLVLMGLAFALVDACTPGRLGEILTESTPHAAAWVTGAINLVTGMIMAACIS